MLKKITYNREFFLFLFLYFNISFFAFTADVGVPGDKNSDKTLKLQTDLLLTIGCDLNDNLVAFETPVTDIKLEGGVKDQFVFETCLALGELFKKNIHGALDTASISFLWPNDFRLNLGLFKTPFSQEYNLGKKTKPYPSHSLSSKKIGTGMDKGISVIGKDLADIFNFEIGLFNGTGQELAIQNNLLAIGKSSLSLKFADTTRFDIGYGAFYSWSDKTAEDENEWERKFGEGGFIQFNQDFSMWEQAMKLFYFAEYLEKRQLTGVVGDGSDWSFGFFNALAFRVSLLEVFGTVELYKAKALFEDPDNELQTTGGLNFYFYKDMVRLSIYYKAESFYLNDIFKQSIVSCMYMSF